MDQKKWFESGNEMTEGFSELMNFEKSFKPELEKKIREYNDLDDRTEKLTAKLTAAKVDLDQKRVVVMAGLKEAAAKITSDLRALAGTPVKKLKPGQQDFNIEAELAGKLRAKASSGAAVLHDLGFTCLKLERDLAEIQIEKYQVADFPFQARRAAARKIFLTLIQTAGLSVDFQYANSGIGQAETWSDKLKGIDLRIAIMKGEAEKFKPLSYITNSADGVLSMASQLPKSDLPKLIEAWSDATIEKAIKIKLTYDRARSLKWFITRSKPEARDLITAHDVSGFDVSSSSDRRAYSTARQRA